MNVFGFDIGHSGMKISMPDGKREFIPSFVCPAVEIDDEQTAKRAERETVKVNDTKYFIGRTAADQGGGMIINGLNANWITTDAHTALFLGGLKKIEQAGFTIDSSTRIMLGLPAKYYTHQKDTLRTICMQHTPASIMVMSQPMGAYCYHMLDEHGRVREGRSLKNESWAVIDVGYFTTDFMVMKSGSWIQLPDASCDAVSAGVLMLQPHINRMFPGYEFSLGHVENAFRTGQIKVNGELVDVSEHSSKIKQQLVSRIMDHASSLLKSHIQDLDGILCAGGGAELIYPTFHAKWKNTEIATDSRFAVSEGFRRACIQALAIEQRRNQQAA